MSECRPCDDVVCVVEPDNRVYSLQGLPPLPPPPAPTPVTPQFSNDTVYYDVDCGEGGPSYSGTLPGWITIDQPNSRMVGAAGTFRADTKALANATAQNALDAFSIAALEDETITCGCFEADIVGTGTSSFAFDLNSMSVNGADAVAVGNGGKIVNSPDGISWTEQTSGTATDLWAVVYGGGIWVAVGSSRKVITSPNMTAWTNHSIGGPAIFYGVAYGAGLFVAADDSGNIYSSPTGTTWTLRNTAAHPYFNIIFGGGKFVAVGAAGLVTTSTNGTSWTDQTSGVVDNLYDVAYNGSKFAAISANTTEVIYSDDGAVWQTTSIASTDASLYAVAGGGGLFVTVTQETGQVWISLDGETWTRQFPDLCPNVYMTDFYGGCQFNVSLPYFPGAGCSGVTISDNSDSSQLTFDAVAVGNRIVTVGDTDLVRTSDNSICWTNHSSGITGGSVSVDFGSGIYLTVGNPVALTSQASTSPDGETWTLQPSFGSGFSRPSGVRFGHGLFVCGIEDTGGGTPSDLGQIWTSTDGTAWNLVAVASDGISFLAIGNGVFLAGIRSTGTIIRSDDGINWSSPITVAGAATSFGYASFGNGFWVMSSDDPNTFYRSLDGGLTWSSVAMAADSNVGPEFGNGTFLVQLSDSKFYTSTDGASWTLHSTGSTLYSCLHYYKDCTFMAIK